MAGSAWSALSNTVCSESGHVYNALTNPPREAGRCDLDGSELIQREDDLPEACVHVHEGVVGEADGEGEVQHAEDDRSG